MRLELINIGLPLVSPIVWCTLWPKSRPVTCLYSVVSNCHTVAHKHTGYYIGLFGYYIKITPFYLIKIFEKIPKQIAIYIRQLDTVE